MYIIRKAFLCVACLGCIHLTEVFANNSYSIALAGMPYCATILDASVANTPLFPLLDIATSQDSNIPADIESQKEDRLKTIIEEEAKQEGLTRGIVNGLVVLYSSISDLVLHPMLVIVLSILTVGLIILGTLAIIMLKREDFSTFNKLLGFGIVYLLLYVDLLFILYEQRKITIMFFSFDKDILLVVLSVVIGYLLGRVSSRRVFEEKVLP